jgi:uncharacterized protein (UPF0261 family)
MATVLLLGTMDTKGDVCAFLRRRLAGHGCDVLTIDAGCGGKGPAFSADVSREEVARRAGTSSEALAREDRGAALDAMSRGAAAIVRSLVDEGRADAILAVGGSGGAALAASAMAPLPLGFPKLLVSTVAAGDTRPYCGHADITLMYPVVDVAGINRISEVVLANAAAAAAGMAMAPRPRPRQDRPLVGMTMFGITTRCVDRVRVLLESRGFEAAVFSANGHGSACMERLVDAEAISGVVDVTTTDLADRLVGGTLPAEEGRLEAAGRRGVPQVVAPGALDVVNFGCWDSVPDRFRDRRLHRHNRAVTLMRTSAAECAELGRTLAATLNAGRGPRHVVLPLRGLSALSAPGGPFHDPRADEALFEALHSDLAPDVEVVEIDTDINDPEVADVLADRFHHAYRLWRQEAVTL